MKTLTQLRRNGYVSVRADGSTRIIGPGPRTRALATRWGISLPEATENG